MIGMMTLRHVLPLSFQLNPSHAASGRIETQSRNQNWEKRMTELQRAFQDEKKAIQRSIEQQSRVASKFSNREVSRPSSRIHHPQSFTKRTDLGVTSPPESSDPSFIFAFQLQRSFDIEDREFIVQEGCTSQNCSAPVPL